ncbi:MAG: imidazole glycerol phosphate synthase subunit HisH [Magnetococcales bacterium]|nr:imidazole glycerol phosphate synthase subunit HisH [Magnetococcales bacterium]
MTTVIDYGSGNLRSVAKALETAGATLLVSSRAEDIQQADALVLPGVGAFADCHRNLTASGLVGPLLDHIQSGKPFLGICVGMQLLFTEGHEFGIHPGLDLIPGKVVGFSKQMSDPAHPGTHLKSPHMGWNRIHLVKPHPLWQKISDKTHFYFVHSFHGVTKDPDTVAALCDYGISFPAAVAKENLFATQFHPEKSQTAGLQLLKNFVEWRP